MSKAMTITEARLRANEIHSIHSVCSYGLGWYAGFYIGNNSCHIANQIGEVRHFPTNEQAIEWFYGLFIYEAV